MGPVAANAGAACAAPEQAAAFDHAPAFTTSVSVYDQGWWAESFTVDHSVKLTQVSLFMANAGSAADSLDVEIRADAGGAPGPILATLTRRFAGTSGAFVDFDFSSAGISLAPGTTYYIATADYQPASDQGYYWGGESPSPDYSGQLFGSGNHGASWSAFPSADLFFQVWGQSCPPDPIPAVVAPDTVAPNVRSLVFSASAFAALGHGGSIARKRPPLGTRISYTLSEPATLRFAVQRARAGRKVSGRCKAVTRRNRKRARCTRFATLRGSFTHSGQTGTNSFRFSGRLRGKKLRPGHYRLVVVATDAARNKSKPKRAKFRVVLR
jgi:hypothetical protein